jgi:hypothetical protein
MKKWFLCICLLVMVLATPAAAETKQVEMDATPVLGGMVSPFGNLFQVNVTIRNGGAPFEGNIRIEHLPNDYQGGFPKQYVWEVKEGEQVIPLYLSSQYMGNALLLHLYDDEGNKLDSVTLSGYQISERNVGVLDNHANAFHFLSGLGDNTPLQVKSLKPEDLPESWQVLENLDLLAIGEVDETRFTASQKKVIRDWVNRGGNVILSYDPRTPAIMELFPGLNPFGSSQKGTTKDLQPLLDFTKADQLPVDSLSVYDRTQPLFSVKSLGKGHVLYVNFDVTEEPLASWQENRTLWKNLLNHYRMWEITPRTDNRHELTYMSQEIPGVQTPSVGLLVLLWAGYILLISPVLYIVLKKKDRREWAWGIVPAAAISISLGMLLIGGKLVARDNLTYSVSLVEITNDQSATIFNSTSFLKKSGGTINVELEDGYMLTGMNSPDGRGDTTITIRSKGEQEKQLLTFEHVPYLTQKGVSVKGSSDNFGAFDIHLSVEGDQLKGHVTNDTRLNMKEAFIFLGREKYPIGPLKRGESKTIDLNLREHHDLQGEIWPDQPPFKDVPVPAPEKSGPEYFAVSFGQENPMQFVGISEDPLPILDMQTDHTPLYRNTVVQSFEIKPNRAGRVVYPYGTLSAYLANSLPSAHEISGRLIAFHNGSVTLGFPVKLDGIRADFVEIPLDGSPYRPFEKELYHHKTQTWKKLGREEAVRLQGKLEEYMNPNGNLLVRFTNRTGQQLELPYPYYRLEGEVTNR